MMLPQKPRKQRKEKNALVDIDCSVEPGKNYRNWIEITKQKLKERDQLLLKQKIEKIESIVNNELALLNNNNNNFNNFAIKQDIIENTNNTLINHINQWSGVKKWTGNITQYREYFKKAKRWWDGRKTSLMGSIFWLRIFEDIEQFVKDMDDNDNVVLTVFNELFKGTVQYPNTKKTKLIDAGTILYSKEIHKYLENKHDLLTIEKWLQDSKGSKQKAKTIYNKITCVLTQIATTNGVYIHTNNNNSNNENSNNKNQSTNTNTNINIVPNNININNINNENNDVNGNNNNWQVPYSGTHQNMYSVSDDRFSPTSTSIIYNNDNQNNYANNQNAPPLCLLMILSANVDDNQYYIIQ